MKSPTVTGNSASLSESNGSTPSSSSRRATMIARQSESRPESRSTRSSDSGASVRFCSRATFSSWAMTVPFTDVVPVSARMTDAPQAAGEPAQHPRMIVADLFEEVVLDDRLGVVRRDGEMGRGHPVDEVSLEHGGIAGDDPAALVGREAIGIGERGHEVVDGPLDGVPDRDGERYLVAQHGQSSARHPWPVARYRAQERLPQGYAAPAGAPTRRERNLAHRTGTCRPPEWGPPKGRSAAQAERRLRRFWYALATPARRRGISDERERQDSGAAPAHRAGRAQGKSRVKSGRSRRPLG